MHPLKLVTVLAVPVVALASVCACGGKSATAPDSTTIVVPECVAPTLDGTVSQGEWSGAKVVTLAGGAELRMMHSGGFLYVALQPKPYPVVTACIERGNTITVAHTSGSLGTATYQRYQEGWYQTAGWLEWCCGDSTATPALAAALDAYLGRRGWTAPNGLLGAPEDTELKIAMPEGHVRLALTYVDGTDLAEGAPWPGPVFPVGLSDDCSNRSLVTGRPPTSGHFTPKLWANIVAGPAAP